MNKINNFVTSQKHTNDNLTKEVEQLHKDKSFYSEQWEKTSKEVEGLKSNKEYYRKRALENKEENTKLKEQLKGGEKRNWSNSNYLDTL